MDRNDPKRVARIDSLLAQLRQDMIDSLDFGVEWIKAFVVDPVSFEAVPEPTTTIKILLLAYPPDSPGQGKNKKPTEGPTDAS